MNRETWYLLLCGIALDFDPYKIHSKVKRKFGKIAFNALLSAKAMPTKIPDKFDADYSGMSWRDFLDLMLEKHKGCASLSSK